MFNIKYTTSDSPPIGLDEVGSLEWIQSAWAKQFAGVETPDQRARFTAQYPDLANSCSAMPGFGNALSVFRGLREAKGKRVLIYGDYDADGITSSAILKTFFSSFLNPIQVDIFIPDRYRHGYGPTAAGIRSALAGAKYDLIVFVDTGSGSPAHISELNEATDADIIIIDHHEVASGDFPIVAHLNPKAHDNVVCEELKECSAAGLAFLLVDEWCSQMNLCGDLDIEVLGVVAAIGTVADVVNLRGINRSIVSRAIHYANEVDLDEVMPDLDALIMEMGGVGFDEGVIGWKIAPAINALSRLGRATAPALNLFLPSTRDAEANAELMKATNEERKDMIDAAFEAYRSPVSKFTVFETKTAELVVSEMSEGLIGLMAAKIARYSNLPCFVGSIRGDVVKFSGRTPDNRVSLSKVVAAAKERNLIISGGGHAGACGFSILRAHLDQLAELFDEVIPKRNTERTYTVAGDLNWLERCSAWVDLVEGLRPFGGPDVERPYIYAPQMTVTTHPSEVRMRKNNKVWAKKFWVHDPHGNSIELTVTDLDLCEGIKRGDTFNMVLQVEKTTNIQGVWVNWRAIDMEPAKSTKQ